RSQYINFQSITQPPILILEILCVVEIFRRLTERFLNFRTAGAVFFGLASGLGIGISLLTSKVLVPNDLPSFWLVMELLDRYAGLAIIVTVMAYRLCLPRLIGVPIRPTATRAAGIFAFQSALSLAASTFTVSTKAALPIVSAFLPTFGCL